MTVPTIGAIPTFVFQEPTANLFSFSQFQFVVFIIATFHVKSKVNLLYCLELTKLAFDWDDISVACRNVVFQVLF